MVWFIQGYRESGVVVDTFDGLVHSGRVVVGRFYGLVHSRMQGGWSWIRSFKDLGRVAVSRFDS